MVLATQASLISDCKAVVQMFKDSARQDTGEINIEEVGNCYTYMHTYIHRSQIRRSLVHACISSSQSLTQKSITTFFIPHHIYKYSGGQDSLLRLARSLSLPLPSSSAGVQPCVHEDLVCHHPTHSCTYIHASTHTYIHTYIHSEPSLLRLYYVTVFIGVYWICHG